MVQSALEKDTVTQFPHFIVLKASAGSGKTYTLTARYVQFLLSDKIPMNTLRNILAITFTNNSAKEMKERILSWLKSVYFQEATTVAELKKVISMEGPDMSRRAGSLIEHIIDNYSDFQVKTIDSFMTTVFKASAIDFGYNPDFEILMNHDEVMKYGFDLFLREVREGTDEAALLNAIIFSLLQLKKKDAAFPWDPSYPLLEEIKKIYTALSATGGVLHIEDVEPHLAALKKQLRSGVQEIEHLITRSGLSRRNTSSFPAIKECILEERFPDLIGKGMKNPPVISPRGKKNNAGEHFDLIREKWSRLADLVHEYASLYAHAWYLPYMKVYRTFKGRIDSVKKQHGKIFFEDINWSLAEYLDSQIVPDVYFRIGEQIFHFLIDEFQDTSPVQWRNLFPLIENSLSQAGSAFIVGDTKQAIYGFRNADYTIMRRCEMLNPFPSALHMVKELRVNYRSQKKIVDFSQRIFRETVAQNALYAEAGERSGLTDYIQHVPEGREKGYAEVMLIERDDEHAPEKNMIQDIVNQLHTRGYRYRDIAILTQKNEDAVRATTWLNEKGIPFISYSSLDIRRRKITGEIVSFLKFLDSPPDDLSFATFILGDIFGATLAGDPAGPHSELMREFCFAHRKIHPLYKSFQEQFGMLWDTYFSFLFKSTGYLPLYDLIVQVFHVFRVFELFPDDEATLVKMLEAARDFEESGRNSILDFIDFARDGSPGEGAWTMDVPKDMDAVQVMTIHKAKGLGFPVGIVLLYEERARGFDYILRQDQGKVSLMKVTQNIVKSAPSLEETLREESVKEKVNRLNSLYVGVTRAQEELYVIGMRTKQGSYPLDILPEKEFPPSQKPSPVIPRTSEQIPTFTISHYHTLMDFTAGPEKVPTVHEKRRGEFIHMVLSCIEYLDREDMTELLHIIQETKYLMAVHYPDNEILNTIAKFLTHDKMRGFFTRKPGRRVLREKEFCDRMGNLFRMDRVILDEDRISVIDFKTGSEAGNEDSHTRQVLTYRRILRNIFPGIHVEGYIAYIDRCELRGLP